MVEKIIAGRNTPLSECVDFPEQKIGFMEGEFSVPADFDSMFKEEIEELFGGGCRDILAKYPCSVICIKPSTIIQ
jgi:hypothetical protein